MRVPDTLLGLPLKVRVPLLVLLLVLLAVALFVWRVNLATMLIPLMQLTLDVCETRFDVAEFNVVLQGAEQRFYLRLVADHPVVVFGRVLPGMDVSATTLVTHLVLALWILGAVLISGILLIPLRVGRLLLMGVLAVCLLSWLDIPLTLLGSIEGLLAENLAPENLQSNVWVQWEQFLLQGGRMVLALGLGLLVLKLSRERVAPWNTASESAGFNRK